MKSLLGKLGLILIGLGIFGFVEARGADWKYFSSGAEGNLHEKILNQKLTETLESDKKVSRARAISSVG